MAVDVLKAQEGDDNGKSCRYFIPPEGTVDVRRICSNCEHLWCNARDDKYGTERSGMSGGIGSYFPSGKKTAVIDSHTLDKCPNAARTEMLINQVDKLESKIAALASKEDLTGAFNSLRDEQRKIAADAEDNNRILQELQSAFMAARGLLTFVQWTLGIIGAAGVAWGVLTGKLQAP